MAGYSGTPLPKKLGIKEGAKVVILHAPEDFAELLRPMPNAVTLSPRLNSKGFNDVIVFFSKKASTIRRELPRLKERVSPAGGIWIAWPKRTSGVPTDLTEDVVREAALAIGLVDNKVCAIDETWSGLRLVIRLKDRPKVRNSG